MLPLREFQHAIAARRAYDAGMSLVAAAAPDDAADALYGIGQLCEEFGISPRALRFYEDKGLLGPRRVNGTRVYSRGERGRLLRLRRPLYWPPLLWVGLQPTPRRRQRARWRWQY